MWYVAAENLRRTLLIGKRAIYGWELAISSSRAPNTRLDAAPSNQKQTTRVNRRLDPIGFQTTRVNRRLDPIGFGTVVWEGEAVRPLPIPLCDFWLIILFKT